MNTQNRPACPPDEYQKELDHFLQRYRVDTRNPFAHAPDLGESLAAISSWPATRPALADLPARCRCLIEGYSGPDNAGALRRFLTDHGVNVPEIVAVDVFDLPAAYARLGLPLPDMRFIHADACQLEGIAENADFDLVAQDFLLNCIPPAHHGRLLTEAARVLSPQGRLLLSFTDSSGLSSRPMISPASIESALGTRWEPHASQLSDLVPDPDRRRALIGRLAGSVVRDPETGHHTVITAPYGRFEFFVPLAQTRELLARTDLEIMASGTLAGRDDHGLDCLRHRMILRPAQING